MHWKSNIFASFFKSKNSRKLALNFTNYGVYQTINYLIPLITIPYIVRVIGVANFGILSFVQALIYYFSIIVEYGFSITGVQLVAYTKGDTAKRSEILSTIFCIQTGLIIIALLILIGAAAAIKEVKTYFEVYLFTFLLLPAQMLQALWFYIGTEEMKFLNIVNLVGRLIYIIAIFTFIKIESDYIYVPLLNSGAMFIAGVVSLVFIIKKFHLRLSLVSIQKIKLYLKDGWHLFLSNLAINLYRNANVLILGLVASKEAVGFYSAGEKLVKAVQSIFTPLTQTFFPYISRLKATEPMHSLRSIKKLTIGMAILSISSALLVFLFAKPLTILLLGEEFVATQIIIKIGSLVIIFGALNYVLGIIFMTNFDMKADFSRSVVVTGIINLILCFVCSTQWAAVGAAVAFSSAEVILFCLLVYSIFTNRKKWEPVA